MIKKNGIKKDKKDKPIEEAEARGPTKSTLREYFESICVAVILALFIRTFVFQAFKIPTGSMEENLLIGDHLIVNKMLYTDAPSAFEEEIAPVRNVRRHDIVVFKFPGEPERDFIKRVIGLPGERLHLQNKKVYINGEPLDEPYVHFNEPPTASIGILSDARDNMPEIVVPEGHYFVMGDNRDNSRDSRFEGVRFIPEYRLVGKAVRIWMNWRWPSQGGPLWNRVGERIE